MRRRASGRRNRSPPHRPVWRGKQTVRLRGSIHESELRARQARTTNIWSYGRLSRRTCKQALSVALWSLLEHEQHLPASDLAGKIMGIRKFAPLSVAAIISLAAACPAQDLSRELSGGVRAKTPDNAYMKPSDKVRITLQAYGTCLIKDNRRQVESFLETWPDSPNYNSMVRRVASNNCIASGDLRMTSSFLRGALYVGLYKIDYKDSPASVSKAPINFGLQMTDASTPNTKVYVSRMLFADCVVRRAAEESRRLVLTTPASKDEDLALSKLLPFLGPCIPQGQNVQFDRTVLSGILAEALYREARSANAER